MVRSQSPHSTEMLSHQALRRLLRKRGARELGWTPCLRGYGSTRDAQSKGALREGGQEGRCEKFRESERRRSGESAGKG